MAETTGKLLQLILNLYKEDINILWREKSHWETAGHKFVILMIDCCESIRSGVGKRHSFIHIYIKQIKPSSFPGYDSIIKEVSFDWNYIPFIK